LCSSPPPTRCLPSPLIIPCVFIPVFSVCLLPVHFVCKASQHFSPCFCLFYSSRFLVFPVFTILPALTPSLPAILHLAPPRWTIDLCLPWTVRLPAVLYLLDSDLDYWPLPALDL
jgi:hypothetical protein